MFGYVTCDKAELKMKDWERYNAYYCGVCKSIGARFGQIPRMILTFDAAFIAVLLAGLTGKGYLVASAEEAEVPSTYVTLTEEESIRKMGLLLEHLEDDDDVQNVWHNWDMPDGE